MINIFFKTTFRNLWRNKGYSFLNIFGLAIGIACAGLIFLWVENEINWDNNNEKKNQLYQLKVNLASDGNNFTMGSTPRPMGKAMQAEISGVANTARLSDSDQRLLFNVGDNALYATGRFADPSIFDMFSFDFIQGNSKNPLPQLYSLVLTESAAEKFFGTATNVIGKTIRVDNKQDYVVSGVVKDLPHNSTLQFEWLAPYGITTVAQGPSNSDAFKWDSYGPFTYVELNKNANLNAINAQLKDFIHRKSAGEKNTTFLYPMSQWHLYNEFANGKPTGGGAITQVRLLAAIAWIIILIACINFMNLATANSTKRAKEIGVRKVLGSVKRNLVFQFIGEAIFMSVIAAVIAVIVIALSLPAFNILMEKRLSLHLENPVHLTGLLAITVICGLIAGSYPSIYLSSLNPVSILKGLKSKPGAVALVRKGLVVVQFTVSVVFIISTIIIYMQIQHVKNRALGFNKNNLLEVALQHNMSGQLSLLKENLLHTGFVENVTIADHKIINGGNTDARFNWKGKPENSSIPIAFRHIGNNFMSVTGIKIVEGRDFDKNSNGDNSNVIITRSFADLLGNESAVGKIIQSPRGQKQGEYKNVTVIGVADDHVYGNMYDRPGPMIFFNEPVDYGNLLYLLLKPTDDLSQALQSIESVMKKNNPAYPFEYKFVDDQFNEKFKTETLMSKLSTLFAALAIIISCLGLFGLAAYTAERRVKEIGIRKVLGASVTGIAGLLSKDFLQLVALSCLVAFPVAWWMMLNWLQNYQYRIHIEWWVFAATGMLSMLIALLTVSFQAIKAAMVNPVISLRTE